MKHEENLENLNSQWQLKMNDLNNDLDIKIGDQKSLYEAKLKELELRLAQ